MRSYGQYCPVARTSELLAERWTPIIIRNLLSGCRTFGELLEDHGILTRQPSPSGRGGHYTLIDKGREPKAVTDAMGAWGARWLELEPQHIDAAYVLWATWKLVDPDKVPSRGLVARVELADRPTQRYWMLLRRSHAEVCSTYPGRAEDLIVRTDSETLAHWHLRHITYQEAARSGRMRIEGARVLSRAFLACIRPSPFAGIQPAVRPSSASAPR
jgi:DNA-binding HxlR family transcriptional regulator